MPCVLLNPDAGSTSILERSQATQSEQMMKMGREPSLLRWFYVHCCLLLRSRKQPCKPRNLKCRTFQPPSFRRSHPPPHKGDGWKLGSHSFKAHTPILKTTLQKVNKWLNKRILRSGRKVEANSWWESDEKWAMENSGEKCLSLCLPHKIVSYWYIILPKKLDTFLY